MYFILEETASCQSLFVKETHLREMTAAREIESSLETYPVCTVVHSLVVKTVVMTLLLLGPAIACNLTEYSVEALS